MSLPVTILVASMTGNAEMAAEAILEVLEDEGFDVSLMRMEKITVTELMSLATVVICSSTYGEGEVPDNGKPLYAALNDESIDLSNLRFAVFGLGDKMNYPSTYNNGGKRWDTILQQRGAKSLLDRYRFDASSGNFADEAAEDWAEELLDALE